MELLVVGDLEGISGIDERERCLPGHPDYRQALDRYAAELAGVATAARALGVTTVTFLDWHQRSLPSFSLPTGVQLASLPFTTRPRAAVLFGFHARAGQPQAFAPQTIVPGVRLYWNGREAGELALASRWLGELGIPLLLVTGDRALTLEAEEWVDQTTAIAVKLARGPDRAVSLPPERVAAALYLALQRVLERRSWWWVYRPESIVVDVTLEGVASATIVASTMAELFEKLAAVLPSSASRFLPLRKLLA